MVLGDSNSCVVAGGFSTPDEILDTSTLSFSMDNMGVVTLTVSIFTKNTTPPTNVCEFCLATNRQFRGFIESSSPVRLEATDFIEHRIRAIGEICEGCSGSPPSIG